jgi:hypothetical protein
MIVNKVRAVVCRWAGGERERYAPVMRRRMALAHAMAGVRAHAAVCRG